MSRSGEEVGNCLFCGAPEYEAPELLAPLEDGNADTFFVRQPATAEETERACRALESCCVRALRYGGTDPAIIRRLGNDALLCDYILVAGRVRWAAWSGNEGLWRRIKRWLRSTFTRGAD